MKSEGERREVSPVSWPGAKEDTPGFRRENLRGRKLVSLVIKGID